jgi:hypothetical protein
MTTDMRPGAIEHRIGRDGVVALNVRDGEVWIRGIDGDVARLWTRDGRPLEGLAIDTGERSLSVRVSGIGDRLLGRERRSRDLELEVPRDASVVVETASADVEIDGLHGDQRYRTASGDLSANGVRGEIAIEAVSGDVDLVADGPSRLRIRTVSGDLAVRAGLIEALRAVTTSGDLQLAGDLAGDGPFTIETVSGDAVLATAGGLRIAVSTITGDIRSDIPSRVEDPGGIADRPRALVVGDGRTAVSFRSTSGDLRVVQANVLQRPSRAADTEPPTEPSPLESSTPEPSTEPPATEASDAKASEAGGETLDVLRALERGDIDITEAERRLAALESTDA